MVEGAGGIRSKSADKLSPNIHGDWINMRTEKFSTYLPIGDKKDEIENSFWGVKYAFGVISSRDSWVWNFNKSSIKSNIVLTLDFYNEERVRFKKALNEAPLLKAENFIRFDSKKITWDTRKLKGGIQKGQIIDFCDTDIRTGIYRPFCKQKIYFNKDLNHSLFSQPSYFPNENQTNRIICVPGGGVTRDFSTLITDVIPDMEYIGKSNSFRLYYYEENNSVQKGLFDGENENEYIRRDAISDFILGRAKKQYGKNVTKEDIFYYVYGFLHSPNYREDFANDLKKMLPRLPLVDDVRDFWAFSKAGRKLADLHLNYETIAPYPDVKITGDNNNFFTVQKMRFPKKDQKDTIIYNSKITILNIPARAYEYVVNGKSAIEWIMERYQVTSHKESGIKNDPNDWSEEVGNPRIYPRFAFKYNQCKCGESKYCKKSTKYKI